MLKRQCLTEGCPALVQGEARCPLHRAQQRAPYRLKYRGDWPKVSKAAIQAHVATFGYVCPGWKVPAHPSNDLVTDHGPPIAVYCRSCNTAKRNYGDG